MALCLYLGRSCTEAFFMARSVIYPSYFACLTICFCICSSMLNRSFSYVCSERFTQPFVTIHDVRCNMCMRLADDLMRAEHPA